MGNVCCALGTFGDGTAFSDVELSDLTRLLEGCCNLQRFSDQIMYDPVSGQQMTTQIFVGATYYQRLRHMVADKLHGRNAQGPVVLLTRQPAEGRARDGGLRMGGELVSRSEAFLAQRSKALRAVVLSFQLV